MLHPVLHRKVAAAGPFTLDDVRDNQSGYSYNTAYPTPHRCILFANDGTDFDGNNLGWTLNSASFATGVGGGLSWPGSGTAARIGPTYNTLFSASGYASVLFVYTLNVAWASTTFMFDYNNRDNCLKGNTRPEFEWRLVNSYRTRVSNSYLMDTTDTVLCMGFTLDQDPGLNDRARFFHSGSFINTYPCSLPINTHPLDAFFARSDEVGHIGSCVQHALVGFNSKLTDQQMIDLTTDPSDLFVAN